MASKRKVVKCSCCDKEVDIDDAYECDVCGKAFCLDCSDKELIANFKAPDNFSQVCKGCAPDPYDGGE